jgi:hypothetical protein
MYQESGIGEPPGGGAGIKNAEAPPAESAQELRNANGGGEELRKETEGAQELGNEEADDPPSSRLPDPSKPILSPDALYGLPGRIVTTVDPYTEASLAAILVNVLVMFGNVIGRSAYFKVEESNHYTNLFAALVGPSSSGRKGQSLSTPKHLFKAIDAQWVKDQIVSGLSSGEGLIYKIRDPNPNANPPDPGAPDKRLQVIEEEFAQALKVMKREGNILSPILRQAWDGNPLQPLTKNNQTQCTSPHISIIGQITPEELKKQLNEIEIANGFANRFMWYYVERSKLIPSPKGVPPQLLQPLISDLQQAVAFARATGPMSRSSNAEQLWQQQYATLSDDRFGLFGVITQRAVAQVLRLSMIYALMGHSSVIDLPHLKAALALWDYSEQSVKFIFQGMTGDTNVDLVVRCGKAYGWVTRRELWKLLGHNVNKKEIDRVVQVIKNSGLGKVDPQGVLIIK